MRGGEAGEAADTDGAAAPGGAAQWNDTWAGEVSPEEQARARALLGLALAGGQETTAAVEEWTRSRPGRGRAAADAGGPPPAEHPGPGRGRRGHGGRSSTRYSVGGTDGPGGVGPAATPDPTDSAFGDGTDEFNTGVFDGYDPVDDAEAAPFGGRSRRGGRRTAGGLRHADGTPPELVDTEGPDEAYDPDDDDAFGRSRGRRGRRFAGGRRRGEGAGAAGPGGDGRRRERRTGPARIDPDADPEAAARAICLRQLTGQPRTRAQLADALRRRGVPDDVAEHVLGRFTEVKLIDDAAFAAAWVDTRHAGRGLARRALARELRQRGVDPDLVHEAVERLDPEQEAETARALVARKLPGTRRLDRQVRMRRLASMLARKGYSEGLALRVVREALDADEADEADEANEADRAAVGDDDIADAEDGWDDCVSPPEPDI